MSTVEGWKRESLGAQLELIRNGYSGQQVNHFTNFPVSRIETISDGTIDLNKVGYVDFIPDSYLLQSGDILFSNINSLKHIGKVGQVSEGTKLFHGMNLLVIRPVEEVDNKFLFYKLINAKPWFEKVAAQAINQASINQGTIKELRIELPQQKPEQIKIAEILSTVDRAIEHTEALIAKQQRIKTGLMQDLLTRGIDEHGNLRSEQTHEFKDSPLGRIPVEWEVHSCIALCEEIVVGIVIRPAQYYRPDGVPVLRSANVKENRITSEGFVFMSDKDNETLSKSRLRKGNLVTVRTGYPGTTGVIPPELDGSNCIDIVISRPNHEKVRSEFLSIWVNSDHGKRQVLEGQGGLAQQHFNVGEMRTLLVKVPDINEQEIIENLLILQRSAIDDLTKNQQKLFSLKTALMQDLLTGKKRVIPLLTESPEAVA